MSPPPFPNLSLRTVETSSDSTFYHTLALTASVGADAALVPYENAVFTLFDKAGRILSWKQVQSELEAHGFGYPAEAACKEACRAVKKRWHAPDPALTGFIGASTDTPALPIADGGRGKRQKRASVLRVDAQVIEDRDDEECIASVCIRIAYARSYACHLSTCYVCSALVVLLYAGRSSSPTLATRLIRCRQTSR